MTHPLTLDPHGYTLEVTQGSDGRWGCRLFRATGQDEGFVCGTFRADTPNEAAHKALRIWFREDHGVEDNA